MRAQGELNMSLNTAKSWERQGLRNWSGDVAEECEFAPYSPSEPSHERDLPLVSANGEVWRWKLILLQRRGKPQTALLELELLLEPFCVIEGAAPPTESYDL